MALDSTERLAEAIYPLRKEIIKQRKEIISLLRYIGDFHTGGAPVDKYPKWIRDRLVELGEDI